MLPEAPAPPAILHDAPSVEAFRYLFPAMVVEPVLGQSAFLREGGRSLKRDVASGSMVSL